MFERNSDPNRDEVPGEADQSDPLPPGPNYGTFGYFRLSILILAIFVAILLVLTYI
jgi:hypothetical protein